VSTRSAEIVLLYPTLPSARWAHRLSSIEEVQRLAISFGAPVGSPRRQALHLELPTRCGRTGSNNRSRDPRPGIPGRPSRTARGLARACGRVRWVMPRSHLRRNAPAMIRPKLPHGDHNFARIPGVLIGEQAFSRDFAHASHALGALGIKR
jgi:hypothetical protein